MRTAPVCLADQRSTWGLVVVYPHWLLSQRGTRSPAGGAEVKTFQMPPGGAALRHAVPQNTSTLLRGAPATEAEVGFISIEC